MKKVLMILTLIFVSSLSAEYLDYPQKCSYIKHNQKHLTRRDMKCYVKWYAAITNRRLPVFTDINTKLMEIKPKKNTLVYMINFNHIRGVKVVGKKRWFNFIDNTKMELNHRFCSPKSKHHLMIREGLKLVFIYKNMYSGKKFKTIVSRKTCGFYGKERMWKR